MTNRERLIKLLNEYGITQAGAAQLICIATQRPCPVRTIRSWVNDPQAASARNCPDWVIEVLSKALESKFSNAIIAEDKIAN